MRKLVRATLRHQAYATHTGHEGFLAIWKAIRIKQGKSYGQGRHRSHDIILRRQKKTKAQATYTGNTYHKPSIWKRFIGWLKRLGGKA